MRKVGLLLSLALTLMLLVAISPVHSQDANELIPDLARELNLWRLELSLGPLVYDPTLEAMAASQADYLMSLADMPNGGDMHIDAEGDDARARSQREPFNWPTYGHPEFISLTEIAAVGGIRSALNFWQNSSIHNRSVTNPNYREVGIAARSMDNLNGDVLFIVVLGGRPDVLTALADPETNQLYLTTEMNAWTGDWIGQVTEFRLLDAERQVYSEWFEWQWVVPLPDDTGEDFFIEYRDAEERVVEIAVQRHQRWSVFDILEEVTEEAPTREAGGLVFATNTPIGGGEQVAVQPTVTPTPLPVASATPTPTPVSVMLAYTNRLFTLIPATGTVDISLLTFRGGTLNFEAIDWESIQGDINLSALPSGNCLQIWQRDAGEFSPPPQCSYVRSVIYLAANQMFWTQGSFDVLWDGTLLATCQTADGQCSVVLPRPGQTQNQG